MRYKPLEYVVINNNPQKTAHFWQVTSEYYRGTFSQCENWLATNPMYGFIWQARLWDINEYK